MCYVFGPLLLGRAGPKRWGLRACFQIGFQHFIQQPAQACGACSSLAGIGADGIVGLCKLVGKIERGQHGDAQ